MTATWVIALILAVPTGTVAHDIPNDVTVQALVRPFGQRLNLLVRVPLKAMRDAEFPKRGPGFLDLARVDASLHNAATLWIAEAIELREGDTRLPDPKIV